MTLKRPLLDAADCLDYVIVDELVAAARNGFDKAELTVMAHGAGTQTSVLWALANCGYRISPGTPGHLQVDLGLFADVGDDGTPCEWPETLEFLERLNYFSNFPLLRVSPGYWNSYLHDDYSGLFDRYLRLETMPMRQFRSCTDWFKVRPQLTVLKYLHDAAAGLGIDLRVRQVIGYSADEEKRAKKFRPELPFIRPWFPLIEWGWTREDTLTNYQKLLPQVAMTIGLPERSGCWFCPFQKRGTMDPVTLDPTPRSWTALYQQRPDLFEKAREMEETQNVRRKSLGKKPIYFYGDKPLTYWTGDKFMTIQMGFDLAEGELQTDDTCSSWGCFR